MEQLAMMTGQATTGPLKNSSAATGKFLSGCNATLPWPDRVILTRRET